MKQIDTTQVVDPSTLQPFTVKSLKFLQDAKAEDDAGIIEALITNNTGSYSSTIPYVISGCVVSDSGKDVTNGKIFYGGKFYEVVGVNGTTNVAQLVLTKTQDATADPLTFTDGTNKNVHDIYKYVATDAASGGDFDANDLVSAYKTAVTTTTSSNGSTITVNVTSGGPFTYSTDTYSYTYHIANGICHLNFKISFTVTGGAVVDKIRIPLPTGVTKNTTLTEAQSYRGMASFSAAGGTTNYVYLQVNSNDDGTEGQRLVLTRYSDGDTSITMSVVATTIRGSIEFPIA